MRFTGLVTGLLVLLFSALSADAQGISLPGAATPGGAAPERSLLVPFRVYPGQTFRAPSVPSASGDIQGDRFAVSAIVVDGINDHPHQGISVKELTALVERMRLASVGDSVPSGFIRYLSLQRLGEIAGAVTAYYRDRGMILAQAYVPTQSVDNERVVLQVFEGILDRVTVEGDRRMSEKSLKRPFRNMAGKPVVQDEVEAAMLAANGYPGTDVFGVFRPGAYPGTSELLLKVTEQPLLTGAISLNNHGSEYTGRLRARADLFVNNPTGVGDRLAVSGLLGLNPANSQYGFLDYQRPVYGVDNRLGIRIARNGFKIGGNLEALGLEGDALEGEVYLRRQTHRGRETGRFLRFGLTLKHAGIEAPIEREDDLSIATVTWGFDRRIGRRGGTDMGQISVARGVEILGAMKAENDPLSSRVGGSGSAAGSEFTRIGGVYQRLMPLFGRGSILLRVGGQYSPDLLTSTEQLALGGPSTVRAYPVSDVLVDSGGHASLEWLFRAPWIDRHPAFFGKTWGEILKASLFVDSAVGWVNDSLASEDESVRLSGYGVGLRLAMERLTGDLQIAHTLGGKSPSDGDNLRAYFTLGVRL
jgi:hemolysin activation/secretion protein